MPVDYQHVIHMDGFEPDAATVDYQHVSHMEGFEPDTAPVVVNSVFTNMRPDEVQVQDPEPPPHLAEPDAAPVAEEN